MAQASPSKRTFLFALTDGEKADPTSLVSFATRLPQVRKSGDALADDEANMQRDSMARIINSLWRNPAVILQTQNWLDSRVAAHRQRSQVGEGTFDRVSIIRCLDEAWSCVWISKATGLRLFTLEQACSSDPDAWRQIFTFLMILSPSLKLPSICKDQEVLRLTLSKRMAECGNRERLLGDKGFLVPETNVVNWLHFGVYQVHFENGRAVKVTHRPSGHSAEIPDVVSIDKTFVLTANWSDFEAALSKGPFEFLVHRFFDESRGPQQHTLLAGSSKEFDAIANSVHKDILIRRDDSGRQMVKVETDFRAQAKAALKRKSMDKAREVLANKKKDISSKRLIAFEG